MASPCYRDTQAGMPRRCHWQPTREPPSFGVLRVDLWFIRSVRVVVWRTVRGAGAGSPIFSLFLSSSGLCFFPPVFLTGRCQCMLFFDNDPS